MRWKDSECYDAHSEVVGVFSTFELAEEFFRTHTYTGKIDRKFFIETRIVDVIDGYSMISTLVE